MKFSFFPISKVAQKLINWEIVAQEKLHAHTEPQELERTLIYCRVLLIIIIIIALALKTKKTEILVC